MQKIRILTPLLLIALIWTFIWYWPHSGLLKSFFSVSFSFSNAYLIDIIITFLSSATLTSLFFVILMKREREEDWRKFLKIERLDIKGIWLCFGLGVIVQIINAVFLWNLVLKPARDFLAAHALGGPVIGLGSGSIVPVLSPIQALLLTVFLLVFWWVEVPEELFFRGYLQNKFQAITGKNMAAVISAIIWDMAHVWGLVNMVERFLYGLLYGFVFRFRQNTTPTMIVHPIGNRSLLLAVTIPQIWGLSISPTSFTGISLLLGINITLLISAIVAWKILRLDRN